MRSLEFQRYGRNKSTLINKSYIESGEYRRKFDQITDNANLARLLYTKAKEMLYHRSGTEYEDMYWIDSEKNVVVASALNEKIREKVVYTPNILKAITDRTGIIAMHNHPHSMPPSIEDINSFYAHGYENGIVICHNGTIFIYSTRNEVSERLYESYYSKMIKRGFDEFDAQLGALVEIGHNGDIFIREVKYNE
ncbi:MAG: hypothetical protein IJS12_03740 [Lachnospiraceae bacterium]|nr:hypothetical protein [Lachnospiraceae bacterium]